MEVLITDERSSLTEADRGDAGSLPELSIVMPCLDEAESLASCIDKAHRFLRESRVHGEIIVADNGSTDGSPEIARGLGARVVHVEVKGYGSALRAGINAARGRFIIMGDADDSYDFAHLDPFVEKLRDGYDLVMGNRFRGGIKAGAMPPLHRYFGNPVSSAIGRLLFWNPPCKDLHCGLRGFRKASALKLDLRTTGFEFSSELIVKAVLNRMRITEVPTVLSPDGRSRPPHLRSWRDGWRHLRFRLLFSPRWLFFYPGVMLMLAGLIVGTWLLGGARTVGGVVFNVHTLLYAAMAILLGFQAVEYATFTKVYAISEGLLPEDSRLNWLFRYVTLEVGLVVGAILMLLGLGGTIWAFVIWGDQSFGPIDTSRMMRLVIPSVLSLTIGFDIVLSTFFLSVLRSLKR
jgi:glycosyltransferase involved in cell wall biosynthesis